MEIQNLCFKLFYHNKYYYMNYFRNDPINRFCIISINIQNKSKDFFNKSQCINSFSK
jgi:hypothetical protein